MDRPRIKPDPDGPITPGAAMTHPPPAPRRSLDEEAKDQWALHDPALSNELLKAIRLELNSPCLIKFIRRVYSNGRYVSLQCSFSLSMGVGSDLDAGRIALFRLINATILNESFWDAKDHYAILNVASVRRAQTYGVDLQALVDYLQARIEPFDWNASTALSQIVNWTWRPMQPGVDASSSTGLR